MVYLILTILGLAAGSFVNAVVWRLHEQAKTSGFKNSNLSILRGRSMCPHCRHILATKDLLPLISWLALRGKCRYCGKPVSIQYPLVELAMAAVFVASYIFWPGDLTLNGQLLLLGTWLFCSVGLMALLVYDFKWMLLPNRIIYPTLVVAAVGRLSYILFYSNDRPYDFWLWALSLVITSGVFWILFEISKGQWIGFGDVRLGAITGTLLADPKLAFLMIFLASVLGLAAFIIGIFGNVRSLTSKIPFGPFLIMSTWLTILLGQSLIDKYTGLLS